MNSKWAILCSVLARLNRCFETVVCVFVAHMLSEVQLCKGNIQKLELAEVICIVTQQLLLKMRLCV